MLTRFVGIPYVKIVRVLAVLVLCSILIAGLWPFHAPRNAVSWLEHRKGLRFKGHGSALSRNPFQQSSKNNATGLEIWLTPATITQQSSILTFDSSPVPRSDFSLRQYGTSVAIQRYMVDDQGVPRRPWFKIDGVFGGRKPILLTITASKEMTALYVDGVIKGESSTLGLVPGDLTGRLVVANSMVDESWSGEVSGLAIYDHLLTARDAQRHFEGGIDQWADQAEKDSPAALYRFDEGQGDVVRDSGDRQMDLLIPAHYFVLHPDFLRSFRDEVGSGAALTRWSYWEDVAVNVGGFIPVGFVFLAYLSTWGGIRRAGLLVVIIGFCLSLTVEVLQRFLPTRNSGMTDLLTNTMGTAIGVSLFRLACVKSFIARNSEPAVSIAGESGEGIIAIDISEPHERVLHSA